MRFDSVCHIHSQKRVLINKIDYYGLSYEAIIAASGKKYLISFEKIRGSRARLCTAPFSFALKKILKNLPGVAQ